MPPSAVLLFEDETILRLFPELRRAWSLQSEQAAIGISGRNAKRGLFGTINVRTGHRVVMTATKMEQQGFQDFLRLLRVRHRNKPVWLLLDGASAHIAPKSKGLAKALDIVLVWLPKQCPALNAMDHLFQEVKADISANYQYHSIDEHASFAEDYILALSNKQAPKRAGILSKNFWLKMYL